MNVELKRKLIKTLLEDQSCKDEAIKTLLADHELNEDALRDYLIRKRYKEHRSTGLSAKKAREKVADEFHRADKTIQKVLYK